jgi:putative PIN family toxin of toxin-antitoxin system
LSGDLFLCVTTEILQEYQEVMQREWSPLAAERVMVLLDNLPNMEKTTVYYFWQLITVDKDDNKFVDCAVAANADYLISHDRHFNELQDINFPKVEFIKLEKLFSLLS